VSAPADRVWVTRAQPEAAVTAARLARLGWRPLVAPLLELRPAPGPLMLDRVAALAFTSRNGVRAFAARSDRRDLPVYAVGDRTAAAAREAGFAEVRSADGDVEALARLIAEARPSGAVLHPGPERPAGDLAGRLRAAGVAARSAVLYAAAARPVPPEAAEAWPELAAVLLHSPRAAEALAAGGLPPPGPPLLCISAKAAAPLRSGFAEVRAAARPTEAALLALLGKPPAPR